MRRLRGPAARALLDRGRTSHAAPPLRRELDHCIFDETSYRYRDARQQRLGRAIRASRNAIVLIPRRPLTPRAMYRAVVEVNGRLVDWTFGISQDRMTNAVVRLPVPVLR